MTFALVLNREGLREWPLQDTQAHCDKEDLQPTSEVGLLQPCIENFFEAFWWHHAQLHDRPRVPEWTRKHREVNCRNKHNPGPFLSQSRSCSDGGASKFNLFHDTLPKICIDIFPALVTRPITCLFSRTWCHTSHGSFIGKSVFSSSNHDEIFNCMGAYMLFSCSRE